MRRQPVSEAKPLELAFGPVAEQFIRAVGTGAAREIACFGARGDRKTSSFLAATLFHAELHRAAGFPLPVPWISVTDTFASHRLKMCRTLRMPWWQGAWRLYNDDHLAIARVGGTEVVHLDLFGIEDQGGMDRVRMETCGVHFEEVAPAAAGEFQSRGVSVEAWGLAITSQRIPSHAKVAVITTNYPSEDHWSWKRFVLDRHPGTMYFRIPPGESASPEDRAEWAKALEGRPDMLRRLLAGEPGSIQLGDPVTPEYRESLHLSRQPVPVADGTLYLGWDAWHHPAVCVASMSSLGQLRIHLARRLDNSDVGAVAQEIVSPWLASHGLTDRPLVHTGDPTAEGGDQSDRSQSAVQRILRILGGQWRHVGNQPEQRQSAIKAWLRRMLSTGEPAMLLGPEAWELHKALSGGWHLAPSGAVVKGGPEGQYSHVGGASAYLCLALSGPAGGVIDVRKWAQQEAYTKPWGGSRHPSQPPIVSNPARFDPEVWRRQYYDEK